MTRHSHCDFCNCEQAIPRDLRVAITLRAEKSYEDVDLEFCNTDCLTKWLKAREQK